MSDLRANLPLWCYMHPETAAREIKSQRDEIERCDAEIARMEAELAAIRKQLVKTREALAAVVRDVNDYERVNNLAPNPGRTECWDSVANAKRLLTDDSGQS